MRREVHGDPRGLPFCAGGIAQGFCKSAGMWVDAVSGLFFALGHAQKSALPPQKTTPSLPEPTFPRFCAQEKPPNPSGATDTGSGADLSSL